MKVTFYGAASTVTGSCYLVESKSVKFLIDCGMFQGIDVESRNFLNFDFDPSGIDFVILTHSHIDHIGLLPKLFKHGFRGKVFFTQETSLISRHLLLDAAKIQEYNESRNGVKALYHTQNALEAIDAFETKRMYEEFSYKGIDMKFISAGHVLGAASIELIIEDKTIHFSGDIGRSKHEFLDAFDVNNKISDYVIMESLYGTKLHENKEEMIKKFIKQINLTFKRNGNVIIPAFALQRTQEILYILKDAYQNNLISPKVDVYVDSPLATKISHEYAQHVYRINGEEKLGSDLFYFDKFRFVNNKRRLLGKKGESKIIIAGSGMADAGRVQSHLIRALPDKKNSVFIVGFQAEETLGRELVNGKKVVNIQNKQVNVSAQICEYYSFSSHADHGDLIKWLDCFDKDKLQKVILVHAEKQTMLTFKEELKAKYEVLIPEWKESVVL